MLIANSKEIEFINNYLTLIYNSEEKLIKNKKNISKKNYKNNKPKINKSKDYES